MTLRERCSNSLSIERTEPITSRSSRCVLIYTPPDLLGNDGVELAAALAETVSAARWKMKDLIRVGYLDELAMNSVTLDRIVAAVAEAYAQGKLLNARQYIVLERNEFTFMGHSLVVDDKLGDNAVKFTATQREPIS